MRKVLIIFILNFICIVAQQNSEYLFRGETILHLINFNNSLVQVQAERILNQGGKWYPNSLDSPGELIRNNDFDLIIANNYNQSIENDLLQKIWFDTEGDDAENVLALSLYKVNFIGNNRFIYFNTISKEHIDLHITYDYARDKFYYGECSICSNEIINGTIIKTFNNYIADELEDYWKNALFIIPNETESYPRLI